MNFASNPKSATIFHLPIADESPEASTSLLPLSYSALYAEHMQKGALVYGNNHHDGDDDGLDDGAQGDTATATKTKAKPKKPSQYKVLLLNDDYTPMEFVVMVLKRFFKMDLEQATRIMLHVHQRGVGVCGIFPYEVAETKVKQVMDFAGQSQHPLQCTLEKA